jgi:hypothetical protein
MVGYEPYKILVPIYSSSAARSTNTSQFRLAILRYTVSKPCVSPKQIQPMPSLLISVTITSSHLKSHPWCVHLAHFLVFDGCYFHSARVEVLAFVAYPSPPMVLEDISFFLGWDDGRTIAYFSGSPAV